MTSEKSKTNKKWTSSNDYRTGHARIFGYKVGQPIQCFVEGFGILDGKVMSRDGDKYNVELNTNPKEGDPDVLFLEVNWDEITTREV
jgi:hypothetical protein